MTPERLDTIERLAKTPSTVTPPFGLGRTLFDSADVLDLIAHIRDLEAQVAVAREAFCEIHDLARNMARHLSVPGTCEWKAEDATATPPSPEVGA